MTTPTLATQQAWPLSLTRRLLDLVRMKSQQAVVCGRKPEQQIVCANRSHETQETIRSYLPLEIGGITERALADTGAQGNIMCEALARELHLRVSKSTTEDIRFVNAVGEPVKQIGHTTIRCTVGGTGPPHTMVARFWVVAKLVERLVVGREFLESTETLTKFRHRLQKVVVDKISGSRVLHSGQPRWRINCVVNGERMLANPDTGSDLDLMSLSYVQRCGLRLHRPELDCQHVEFADSSQKNLSGFVLVPFCFGSSHASGADQVLRRFYVLNGLTCDVLIGNNTLEEFDAFATFRNELVEVEEYDAYSDFQLIRWVQKSGEADILDQSFRDFNISFNPTGRHDMRRTRPETFALTRVATASKPAQKPRLSVLSRLRSLISRRQNSKCCRPMTVEESQALLDQYLRYQDLKESRRRKIESDRIAKLPLSASQERASAEAEEAALKDQYERDRSDFMARHGAIQKLVNSPVHLGSVGVPNVDSEH